jgi:hypothetical protein
MHHLPSRSPGLPPHSACRFTSDPHPNAEVARFLALRNGLLPAHSHRQLRSTWTAPPGSADDSRRPVALLSRHRFAGTQNPPTRTPASRPRPRHHTATHIRGDLPTSGHQRASEPGCSGQMPSCLASGRRQEPSQPADRGSSGAIARRLPGGPVPSPPRAVPDVWPLPTRIALSYLTHWVQRSRPQARLPADARSLGLGGLWPTRQVL